MFPKVSVRFPGAAVIFPNLNLAKALLAVGYTGMAAVFISALTYLLQISADPAAATAPLTLTFPTLNLLAWMARDLGPAGRILGWGWYCSLTAAFTGSLYYLASPPDIYIVFIAVWIGLLTVIVVTATGKLAEPFTQPAYWPSVLLGLGLIACWSGFWERFWHLHLRFPLSHAFALQSNAALERSAGSAGSAGWLAPVTLLIISGAFLVSSFRQRRYPTIALSMWGYGVNYALVEVASYLPFSGFGDGGGVDCGNPVDGGEPDVTGERVGGRVIGSLSLAAMPSGATASRAAFALDHRDPPRPLGQERRRAADVDLGHSAGGSSRSDRGSRRPLIGGGAPADLGRVADRVAEAG